MSENENLEGFELDGIWKEAFEKPDAPDALASMVTRLNRAATEYETVVAELRDWARQNKPKAAGN